MQLHYHYASTSPPLIRVGHRRCSSIPVSPDIKALRVVNPLAPVEIPCAPKDQEVAAVRSGQTAMADSPFGEGVETGLLMLLLSDEPTAKLTANFDGQCRPVHL